MGGSDVPAPFSRGAGGPSVDRLSSWRSGPPRSGGAGQRKPATSLATAVVAMLAHLPRAVKRSRVGAGDTVRARNRRMCSGCPAGLIR